MWHWLASAYFIVLFFFSLFDPGNSLKFMMGATVRSLAIIGIAAFISGMFTRWIAKTITLSPHTQRNYPELQKRLNGWLSSALKVARFLTVCVAVMLLLNARDYSISGTGYIMARAKRWSISSSVSR